MEVVAEFGTSLPRHNQKILLAALRVEVFSAGLKGGKIEPKAVQVLREIGIKVSTQEAKRLDVLPTHDIDLIVMLGEPD